MDTHQALVGRQPIFDRNLNAIAYELLFRSAEGRGPEDVNGNRATSEVLLHTFVDIGLDTVVGNRQAFVNFPRDFLVGALPIPFIGKRIVLEVLEDVTADEEVLAGLSALSRRGHRIALDDFRYGPDTEPLLELADLVKLDLRTIPSSALAEQVAILRRRNVQLVAEKVETHDELQACRELGFDLFQGYFLCRPDLVAGRKLTPSRLTVLRLLIELQNPDAEFGLIEGMIARDAALSYKLLRSVNAAHMATRNRIGSVRQALTMLGLEHVRSLASLIVLTNIDDKPNELLVTAALRAKMCECLARAAGQPGEERHFTVGLLSALDALMDQKLETLLTALPVSQEICEALLRGEGALGETLNCAMAYERGDWARVNCFGLDVPQIRTAYLDSLEWTRTLVHEFGSREPAAAGERAG